MKRILLALTAVGLLLPLAPRAEAATEVSLNLFYDNLSPHGSWYEVADYGYCFQPSLAVSNRDWRPYTDGYWAYTDLGWTWVSYEDFGWATYHYGRWTNLDSYGWVWVPGYDWGPAWVSWRTGGDYVGWAPLPPVRETVYEGRPITGQVDIQFGIGPLYYNFVDIRYIGEPVLRSRIIAPARNVTVINRTVNVTNITYNNSTVYNYGPDYNRLNQYSSRPIQRLSIQRETTVGANLAQGGKRGNFNRVSGNQLTVVAPTIEKSQQQIAPKQVKAKVEKPQIERGWKGVADRQKVEAEMKKDNAQDIPAPSFKPQKNRKREAVAEADKNRQRPIDQSGAEKAAQPAAADAEVDTANQNAERQQNRAERAAARRQNQEKPSAQPSDRSGQAEQGQANGDDAAERRAQRQEKMRERRAQAEDQNGEKAQSKKQEQSDRAEQEQPDQSKNKNRRPDRVPRAQEADQQPDQADAGGRRAEREAQRAERPDNDQNQRAERKQRAERGQRAEEENQRPERANASERKSAPEAQRPERPERPQQQQRRQKERAQQQDRQQQDQSGEGGNQDEENNQRKGKKKKPDQDQPEP